MRGATIVGIILAVLGLGIIGGGIVWMQRDMQANQEALRERYADMTFEEQFADSLARTKAMHTNMSPEEQQAEYERLKARLSSDPDAVTPVVLQPPSSEREEAGLDLDTIVTLAVALGGLLVVLIIAGFLGIRTYLSSGDGPEQEPGPS